MKGKETNEDKKDAGKEAAEAAEGSWLHERHVKEMLPA